MSNITKTNGTNIVNIKVPNLNSAEYAQGLEQVFDNINNNFQTLANHEFIKGDTGNSVFIKNELIYDSLSESYTDIGKQIKSTIYNGEDILPSITINNNVFNWDDNLKSSSINMLVSIDNHETNYTENYVSSLYFVFLDGRFINTNQNFKLSDIFVAAFEEHYIKSNDARARKMALLVKYGTVNEKQIWMLRYGFTFEDIEWLEPYIVNISQEEVTFNREINKLPLEKIEIIKRFV